jgi:hypothetical protein
MTACPAALFGVIIRGDAPARLRADYLDLTPSRRPRAPNPL